MKFLIKKISPSKKEVRLTLNPVNFLDTPHYIFGSIDNNFDEGTIGNNYIPSTLSQFVSVGPNPGIIRLIVAYLKDNLGTPGSFRDVILTTSNNEHIPVVNIALDDINLITLNSDTLPSIVVKLLNPISDDISELDEVLIEKQILTTQEKEVYYIPSSLISPDLHGLDYDIGMKDEVND